MVFFTGVSVTIFVGIQEGIFATIGLSVVILISGIFNAEGRFLGSVRIWHVRGSNGEGKAEDGSTNKTTGSESYECKEIYLPLDRSDGSNPLVELERPLPGIFVYRFTEGFNYTNSESQ